jgi:hypothetical protein
VALALLALAAGAGAVRLHVPRALAEAARRQLYVGAALRALVERPVLGLARWAGLVDDRVVDAAVDGAGRAGLALADAQDGVERRGIDAAVDGVARLIGRGGEQTRRIQTGRLYEYLRDTVLGAAAIALLIALTALT